MGEGCATQAGDNGGPGCESQNLILCPPRHEVIWNSVGLGANSCKRLELERAGVNVYEQAYDLGSVILQS